MIDTLSETIGTLGILASLAAQFGNQHAAHCYFEGCAKSCRGRGLHDRDRLLARIKACRRRCRWVIHGKIAPNYPAM
jgi:hypothetical protein